MHCDDFGKPVHPISPMYRSASRISRTVGSLKSLYQIVCTLDRDVNVTTPGSRWTFLQSVLPSPNRAQVLVIW